MPLYRYFINETNGDYEYHHEFYIIHRDMELATVYAKELTASFYESARKLDWAEDTYSIPDIEWCLDGIEEMREISVFDVENKRMLYIPFVLPSADPVVREYLKMDGVCCLKCGGRVEGGHIEVDCGEAWQEVRCLDCEACWTDVYKLVDVEVRDG